MWLRPRTVREDVTMQTSVRDRGLREASSYLTKALQALQGVAAYDLAEETFRLANRVLQARQQLQPAPQQTTEATTV